MFTYHTYIIYTHVHITCTYVFHAHKSYTYINLRVTGHSLFTSDFVASVPVTVSLIINSNSVQNKLIK